MLCLDWAGGGLSLEAYEWEEGDGFRSAALSVPEEGKPGFTRLAPEATGITFTNQLTESQAAVNRIRENGSGVALGDMDGDGRCDIYFCRLDGPNRLYRNRGDWEFEEISAAAGVECPDQFSTGAVFADVDGDGDLDLFVNGLENGTRLFFNDGEGRFRESQQSGLDRQLGSTSMALADVDGDGDLDLYVANYRNTTIKDSPPGLNVDVRMVDGEPVVSPADRFVVSPSEQEGGVTLLERGQKDFLYLNDGEGHFTPVSWTGGAFRDETGQALEEPPRDWGLSVMFRDLNEDRAPDIYVCNDFYHWRDRVWINDGEGAFQAIQPMAMRNMSMSSMSIDFADINRDQAEDFFVVDMLSRDHSRRHRQRANVTKGLDQPIGRIGYRPEVPRNTLYLNRGDGTYTEIAQLSGLEASEWSWSTLFLDVDLDGYEDVLITNGHGHDVLDADVLRELSNQRQKSSLENRVQNLRRFPPLHTANLAFHNQGNAAFVEKGSLWGFDALGISHGMAAADLDRDGDLDLVVNNYNAAAGVYRNESAASRVTVRLAGRPPNVQGIGAQITVEGGPVLQQQTVIGGGRYLSGDDPVRVFAAGEPGDEMTIRVTWRSGRQSRIAPVKPNRIYEIREPSGDRERDTTESPSNQETSPYFADVSDWLSHEHEDKPFDDFVRQPLLPRRLSQPGPGVAWYDLDGDGWDDLLVGAGDGGQLTVFHNRRGEQFERVATPKVRRDQTTVLGWSRTRRERLLLAGSSNYEDGSEKGGAVHQYNLFRHIMEDAVSGQAAAVGPLAMGDIENDGDLDLFVGGRVMPGRYPEAVSSRVYRNEAGTFELDTAHRDRFEKLGLVNGAVWSDLNGDGSVELILACEWGPIRVYQNQQGQLMERTELLGLADYRGWWNGVATGDFNEDGRLDIVASNWGRNTRYERHRHHPLRIYYGNADADDTTEVIEAYYDRPMQAWVPWQDWSSMSRVFPWIQGRLSSYRAYGNADLKEILGDAFDQFEYAEVQTLESMLFLNRGDHFEARPLPLEAQFAPALGVAVGDYNGDGHEDIFLAQNFFAVEPETSRYDGGRGLWLRGNGAGELQAVGGQVSGVKIYGEQRGCAVADLDRDGRLDLAVGQNRAATRLFHNQRAKPGLLVRLLGPPANPHGLGAKLRLVYSQEKMGPVRELQAGSGYGSQNSATTLLGKAEEPVKLWVQWPGGREITVVIPEESRELVVDMNGGVKKIR